MIEKTASHFSTYLAKNGGVPEKQKIYAYGIECLLNDLISDCLLLLCGIIMHQLMPMLIWCISFTLIRIHLGGFHTATHGRCIFIGTLLGISSVYVNSIWILFHPWLTLAISIFSLLLAVRYAPLIHKNHPVSDHQKQKARKKAICFIILEGNIGFFFLPTFPTIISPVITGILTASAMAALELGIRKFSLHHH